MLKEQNQCYTPVEDSENNISKQISKSKKQVYILLEKVLFRISFWF